MLVMAIVLWSGVKGFDNLVASMTDKKVSHTKREEIFVYIYPHVLTKFWEYINFTKSDLKNS